MVGVFARLGVKKIRLTGGEPLLRRNLPELAARISSLDGIEDLSISTNATQLAKHALALRQAGVQRLNVSVDSLRRERFLSITGKDSLPDVLAGLEAARQAGFQPIKINMVVMKGVNHDEVDDMVQFCITHGFVLRLIEVMPMGDTGRNAEYVDLQVIKHRLIEDFGLVEGAVPGARPARYLRTPDGSFSIGFITPLSWPGR
ncbi:GTP 3',8-cyclase MoaA [endosymbiont of unidentified scaly snail isolate Monju]